MVTGWLTGLVQRSGNGSLLETRENRLLCFDNQIPSVLPMSNVFSHGLSSLDTCFSPPTTSSSLVYTIENSEVDFFLVTDTYTSQSFIDDFSYSSLLGISNVPRSLSNIVILFWSFTLCVLILMVLMILSIIPNGL